MNERQRTRRHDEAAISQAREGRESGLNRTRVAHIDGADLHADRWRHVLDDSELADSGGYRGISKDRRWHQVWRDLLEQLRPFRAQTVIEQHKASSVAARP